MSSHPVDACTTSQLLRSHATQARDLTISAYDSMATVNPSVGALIHADLGWALRQADAVRTPGRHLAGVPIVVKDAYFHVKGRPYYGGSTFLRDRGHTAPHTSRLARHILQAGFVIIGVGHSPEFASAFHTESEAFGVTRNPAAPDRCPAGSSGGSAAAVASGIVPIAHGNDIGGSVRAPASACGIVGFKPTRGRVASERLFGGLIQDGFLSRSIRDQVGILQALDLARADAPRWRTQPGSAPADTSVGRLRIGVIKDASPELTIDPECVAAVDMTAHQLTALGHEVAELRSDFLQPATFRAAADALFVSSIRSEVGTWAQWYPGSRIELEPRNTAALDRAAKLSDSDRGRSLRALSAYCRRMARAWNKSVDMLLTPTMPHLPPLLGSYSPGTESLGTLGHFTRPFNVTGQPAISLPVHASADGTPVGVQLVAPRGMDLALLGLASQLEAQMTWRVTGLCGASSA